MMLSSRGCPYECIFCSQRAMTGRRVRYHDIDVVIRQLETLANRYHQTHVVFADDNIVINKTRVLEFCNEIERSGLNQKLDFDCQNPSRCYKR